MCFKLEKYIQNDKFVNTFILAVCSLNYVHCKAKSASCLMKDGNGRQLFSEASFAAMNQAQELNSINWVNQPNSHRDQEGFCCPSGRGRRLAPWGTSDSRAAGDAVSWALGPMGQAPGTRTLRSQCYRNRFCIGSGHSPKRYSTASSVIPSTLQYPFSAFVWCINQL